MAENEAGVAEQEQETQTEPEFVYPIKVEEVGPAARKVTVEIPRDRITAKLEEQYKELRSQAVVPGFRVGHAPRKLLEKRFSEGVKEQVAGDLVRESYQQALTANKLEVIGEPEFDSQEAIKLPDEGPLNYSFSVEVIPAITLPDFANLKVQKQKLTIGESNIDQAMQNLREQQGALVPVEDRGVQTGDYLLADVHLKLDGKVVGHRHDGQIVARPSRLAGFQIDDLDTQLAGMKPDEIRSVGVKVPADHADEQIRGKNVEIEIALKDIKRLELAEISPAFLEDLGFKNVQELRQALREQMVEKINSDVAQSMRRQVNDFLLANTPVELASKMSSRQLDRVVNRRAMELQTHGVPREQIEANLEQLRVTSTDDANRELRLFFILQKIASDANIEVSEGELNSAVAMLAAQNDQRPEKLKQAMQKDGSLSDLYLQMRDQKAIDGILAKVQIEEIEMTPQQGEIASAAPAALTAPEGQTQTQADVVAQAENAPQGENTPQS